MADFELKEVGIVAAWVGQIPVRTEKLTTGETKVTLAENWVLARATPEAKFLTPVNAIAYDPNYALAQVLRKYADILDSHS